MRKGAGKMEKGTSLEELNNVEGTKGIGREEEQNRDTKTEESVYLEFESRSHNEQFARVVAAVFAARLDPTVEEVEDLKTAVSEAVTNAIIHGYEKEEGIVHMRLTMKGRELSVEVRDDGVGIADVKKAMEPLYTSKPSRERSGMGFSFMEAFMDNVWVDSAPGQGTTVRMVKKLEERLAR
jgi:stage II sporulation protein AB (anti-sigma F factor)